METGKVTAQSGLFRVTEANVCGGCGTPYTFSNAQAVNTRDWMQFCSPTCERNPDIEREHARLKDAVVEVVKACRAYDKAHIAPCGRVYSPSDLWSAVDALIAFEAEHKIGE